MSIMDVAKIRRKGNNSHEAPIFLMCPPDYYEIRKPNESSGSANDFETRGYIEYKRNKKEFQRTAEAQWQNLKNTFISIGAKIIEIDPENNCPDLVFTADPSLSITNNGWDINRKKQAKSITLLSRFSNEERQNEVAISAAFFEKKIPNHAIVESHYRMEGSGDNVYDVFRDIFWSGYSKQPERKCAAAGRSDLRAHEALSATTGVEAISLPVSRPFFHIDTSLAPLSKGHIVFYKNGVLPEAIQFFYKKAFADYDLPIDKHLIPVSKNDAERLACNLVCINNTVVMPACSHDLQERIRKAGYEVITRDVSRFIAAGGAIHCLTNNINQQRIVGGLSAHPPKESARQFTL
ncbi:MAG: arginine deiminase-related protein [Alphaproteobacteria bacterium]|nr:arginine deiminase-related protein [Alphaproteobacteria bacterium]